MSQTSRPEREVFLFAGSKEVTMMVRMAILRTITASPALTVGRVK